MKKRYYLFKFTTREGTSGTRRVNIQRALHGFKDFSCKGQYIYDRAGLFDEDSCIQIGRGIYIVSSETARKMKDIIGEDGDIYCREIIATASDIKALSKKPKRKKRI